MLTVASFKVLGRKDNNHELEIAFRGQRQDLPAEFEKAEKSGLVEVVTVSRTTVRVSITIDQKLLLLELGAGVDFQGSKDVVTPDPASKEYLSWFRNFVPVDQGGLLDRANKRYVSAEKTPEKATTSAAPKKSRKKEAPLIDPAVYLDGLVSELGVPLLEPWELPLDRFVPIGTLEQALGLPDGVPHSVGQYPGMEGEVLTSARLTEARWWSYRQTCDRAAKLLGLEMDGLTFEVSEHRAILEKALALPVDVPAIVFRGHWDLVPYLACGSSLRLSEQQAVWVPLPGSAPVPELHEMSQDQAARYYSLMQRFTEIHDLDFREVEAACALMDRQLVAGETCILPEGDEGREPWSQWVRTWRTEAVRAAMDRGVDILTTVLQELELTTPVESGSADPPKGEEPPDSTGQPVDKPVHPVEKSAIRDIEPVKEKGADKPKKRESSGEPVVRSVKYFAAGRELRGIHTHETEWGRCEYRVLCLDTPGHFRLTSFIGNRPALERRAREESGGAGTTWTSCNAMFRELTSLEKHHTVLNRWFQECRDRGESEWKPIRE